MKPAQFRSPTSPNHPAMLMITIFLVLAFLLGACQPTRSPSVTRTPAPTETLSTPEPTRLPTVTPTPFPLGSQENPFVIAFVSDGSDPLVEQAQQEVALQVANYTRKSVISQTYPDYVSLLDDLEAGRIHVTWLLPLTYLYASQRGLAKAALITSHFGVYQYGAQYMANVDSHYTPYFDPISGLTSADAATALGQFQNQRPCWVDPESTSGYIVPAGMLTAEAIQTQPAVFTQTHIAVVRALYIKGICDFGATFSTSGDPRTSAAILDDLTDAMNRVIIIWRTEPIIPNLNISLNADLNDRDRSELINAFLEINKTSNGKILLSTAAGNYQIEDLKVIEDSLYNPLRKMVDALDLNLQDLIGK